MKKMLHFPDPREIVTAQTTSKIDSKKRDELLRAHCKSIWEQIRLRIPELKAEPTGRRGSGGILLNIEPVDRIPTLEALLDGKAFGGVTVHQTIDCDEEETTFAGH